MRERVTGSWCRKVLVTTSNPYIEACLECVWRQRYIYRVSLCGMSDCCHTERSACCSFTAVFVDLWRVCPSRGCFFWPCDIWTASSHKPAHSKQGMCAWVVPDCSLLSFAFLVTHRACWVRIVQWLSFLLLYLLIFCWIKPDAMSGLVEEVCVVILDYRICPLLKWHV